MKNILKKLHAPQVGLLVIAIGLITFASSCSRSNNNTGFNGTYYGTLVTSIYSEADTIVITSGSTSSAVVLTSHTHAGSSYVIQGTVSGSSLNIPSAQVYIPSLTATYTVSGSGTLTGTKLVLHYVFVSSTNSTSNWTFTGNKQ